MHIKIWLYCATLIVHRIIPSETISIHSIVRLKCNFCNPQPDKCCVGTSILPKFILTTAYCANLCQSIKRGNRTFDIAKRYTPTRFKNGVILDNFVIHNDIALLYFENDKTYNKHVKLSAVDVRSAIGRKASVLVLDNNKPLLRVTMVKKCEELIGYYVCSARSLMNKHQKCQNEQGLPLLLDERVIGITGKMDRNKCHLPQMPFVALSPAYDWIRSITYNNTQNNYSELKGIPIRSYPRPILRSNSNELNATALIEKDNCTGNQNNVTKTDKNNNTEATNTTTIEIALTSNLTWSNHTENVTVSLLPKSNSSMVSRLLINNHTSDYNVTTKSDSNPKNPKLLTSSVTKIPSTAKKQITAMTTKAILRALKKITAITADLRVLTTTTTTAPLLDITPYDTLGQNKSTTSVMDWFNKKYRNKLLKSPPPILILSTTTPPTQEFEDLT